ncbi:MAG: NAD(P)/FAD-dependent oxidoreductase [Alphaproteobacteria bacterium]
MQKTYDVIMIGAGAAGLMCALTAGSRGRSVLLLDHAKKTAEKIRISGGGRCNFTNIHCSPENFLSQNPHFCKSALKQYTQFDFIELVQKHGIAFHEKTMGQLFCDGSSQQIIDMLLKECSDHGVEYRKETKVDTIKRIGADYILHTSSGEFSARKLVIATGGLSIPKIGASKFGYDIARQFGLNIVPTRAALVPLTFTDSTLDMCKSLSGISVEASVSCNDASFAEGLLFTHRGLSGPSILQISSYWHEGEDIKINLAANENTLAVLQAKKQSQPKQAIKTAISEILPSRLAETKCAELNLKGNLADQNSNILQAIDNAIHNWRIKPAGTEGYRTAEVTLGGIDTAHLSSKTMECIDHPGLYFIGEVVDVTGHLGGFNFQWAWSSGYVAGINI